MSASAGPSTAATFSDAAVDDAAAPAEYVTFRVADQWLGIPVLGVQEVLTFQRLAAVPMAPPAIAGFLNLRGQIVTALDLRTTLGLPSRSPDGESMKVVVRHDGELFAFIVDEVGDVVSVDAPAVLSPPASLDPRWRAASVGIVRREHDLLLIVSAQHVLRLEEVASP